MRIATNELRETVNQLLDHLESLGANAVEIEDDYYWQVPKERVYDPAATDLQPTLGQLTDDWNELSLIRRGERPPVAVALVWLSSVLRAVGERVIG